MATQRKIKTYDQMRVELDSLKAPDDIKKALLANKGSSDCTVTIDETKSCVNPSGELGHEATITCKNPDGTTSTNTWCSTKQV